MGGENDGLAFRLAQHLLSYAHAEIGRERHAGAAIAHGVVEAVALAGVRQAVTARFASTLTGGVGVWAQAAPGAKIRARTAVAWMRARGIRDSANEVAMAPSDHSKLHLEV